MSKVEITGAQYPLHKVFSSDFVFTIPPYQRPYSWKIEHATALLEDRLARFVISRCYVVVVSTSDLDSAYKIFSVLNDRGLDLSHTDILKAETIGAIAEAERGPYTDKWVREENELGREHFDALFGHIRMVYAKVKAKTTILKEFRDSVVPSRKPKQFIDEVLVPMATAFYEVLHAAYESKTKADQINGILRWLNRIENSDWVPPALSFFAKYRGDPDRIYRFIVDLERLAAYLMLSRSNINYRIDRYGQVLHDIEMGVDLHESSSSLQLTAEERSLMYEVLNDRIYTEVKIRLYVTRARYQAS